MPFVVIDKSWLQGTPAKEIDKIASSHRFLMPFFLLYELLTTAEEADRIQCFKKLIRVQHRIDLVEHIGVLLEHEVKKQAPCTPIQNQIVPVAFQFNEALTKPNFVLNAIQEQSISDLRKTWEVSDIEKLKRSFSGISYWFPDLRNYRPGFAPNLIERAKTVVSQNSAIVRTVYGSLRKDSYPPAENIDENWAWFRRTQVYLLAAIDYVGKYGAGNSAVKSKKIPNSYLDLQYCVLGALTKGLATRDNELRGYFKLVCPEGVLVS